MPLLFGPLNPKRRCAHIGLFNEIFSSPNVWLSCEEKVSEFFFLPLIFLITSYLLQHMSFEWRTISTQSYQENIQSTAAFPLAMCFKPGVSFQVATKLGLYWKSVKLYKTFLIGLAIYQIPWGTGLELPSWFQRRCVVLKQTLSLHHHV